MKEIGVFLSKQSLAQWPSFREEICVGGGVVAGNLNETFTFDSLHNPHLDVPRLLKTRLTQYLL